MSSVCSVLLKTSNGRQAGRGGVTFSSFSSVHPLNVLLVTCLQLRAFELEGVRHQSRLGSPRIRAQADLVWDLKALQLVCKRRRQ